MADLDAIFKAYDIRGTAPDQLDAERRPGPRRGLRRVRRRPGGRRSQVLVGATCGRRAWSSPPRSPTACGPRASTSSTSAWPPPTSCTSPPGKLDAPGAMFTASHNPAQYNGIKLCLAGARPVGEDTGLVEIKAMTADGVPAAHGPAGGLESLDLLPRLRRPRALLHRPHRAAAAQGRGRHRQRHGRARRAGRVRRPALRPRGPLRRARRHVPEPSGRPDPAGEPARPPGPGARGGRRRRPGLRRRRRPRVPRRRAGRAALRLHHHRDRGGRGPREEPGRHDPAQLHLLEGGARGRAGARRHPGAHQGRPQLHQGGDGRHRRRVRRRALRPLLLPRQLAGRLRVRSPRCWCSSSWARPACRCRSCAARSTATRRPARSTPRSTIPRR